MSFSNILQIIEILAVGTGVVFALYQLRQYHRRRERDATMVLLNSLQTPEFSHGMGLLFELPEGLNKEELQNYVGDNMQFLYVLFAAFESIGILVYRNEMNLALVHDFFSGPVKLCWRKCGTYFKELRQETNQETIGEWVQWLADRLSDLERQGVLPPAHIAFKDWTPSNKKVH